MNIKKLYQYCKGKYLEIPLKSDSSGGDTIIPPDVYDPNNPDSPIYWDTVDDPDGNDSYKWNTISDPTFDSALIGGNAYPAPSILGARYWKAGMKARIRLNPNPDMEVVPAKYDVYIEKQNITVQLTADSTGYATYEFDVKTEIEAPYKDAVSAVAIDRDGNRSTLSISTFRVLPNNSISYIGLMDIGDAFPAPIVECEEYNVINSGIHVIIHPSEDSSATPVSYKIYVDQLDNIMTVEADENGTADFYVNLVRSIEGGSKVLIAAAGMSSDHKPGFVGRKIIKVVENDIVLPPIFLIPEEDDEPFNNEYLVFNLKPADTVTLCNDPFEVIIAYQYRVLDKENNTVFDSNIIDVSNDGYYAFAGNAPDIIMDPGEKYTVYARIKGNNLGWSSVSTKTIKVSNIKSPTLITPVDGVELDFVNYTTLPLWELSNLGFLITTSDTFTGSQVKVSRDRCGVDIIYDEEINGQINGSIKKEAGTSENIYTFGRVKTNSNGWSPWSVPIHNTTARGLTSQSFRKLWIDDSIDCVCIEFDYWGTPKTLQVPFAKYRYENTFTFNTYNLDVVELTNFNVSTVYINGTSLGNTTNMPIIKDSDLQTRLAGYKTDKSGRENTDIWMKYTNYIDSQNKLGVPAIQACRELSTKGIAVAGYFDCPNPYELAIAWIESDNIDLLDPTAESYPNRKLGKTNPEGRFKNSYIWTSTEYSATYVRNVNANGYVLNTNKNYATYVLPCKVI